MYTSSNTVDQVAAMVAVIGGVTGRLDPDAVADGEVQAMLGHLARAQRLLDGAVTLLARRSVSPDADTKTKRRAAAALAETTRTTTAAAKRRLATSAQLAGQAAVVAAVRRGTLSAGQTDAIADACAADPEAQADLLAAARSQSLADLRQTCRDRRQQADGNREATWRRQYRRRSLRTWCESDGEWRAALSAPADLGARFEAALRADHDAVFTAAHAAGRREDDACYRLDALVNLMERGAASRPESAGEKTASEPAEAVTTTGGSADPEGGTGDRIGQSPADLVPARRSGRQATVIVTVDAAALRRGRLRPGESCRIAGVGEVALAAVKAVIPEAHLAYVIRDAVDVRSVVHLGRQVTAHQRTALLARGYECEVPHCRATHLLEIDHVVDWAHSRRTIIGDLAWFCAAHHADKTSRGFRLVGPPGRRHWISQTGVEISRDPPSTDPPDHDPPTHGVDPTTARSAHQRVAL